MTKGEEALNKYAHLFIGGGIVFMLAIIAIILAASL